MTSMPVVIRQEYLDLMDGDHCAAAILNAFEMWSKNKRDFIYKSAVQMRADLMGLFGINTIGKAFIELRRRGFLLSQRNPNQPTDQTLQYQFQPLVIVWAAFNRLFMILKPQALRIMLQTLFLKSQALILKRESESISEIKSEINPEADSKIISEERDYSSEGIDPSKFLQDDPPDLVPPYLRQQPPSTAIRQQLATYAKVLGLTHYAEVIARCGNARSWEYVIKSLANEQAPTPSSATPPSPYDIAKADHDEWMRKFKQSKYLDFISNADDITDSDGDPDATPEIDIASGTGDEQKGVEHVTPTH